ncbi:MAG: hypothetical protein ATN32_07440 [Candidatus Epulonipiscium fishelsonii]|nr:MAG: hypothetical protein ATN32_07440 [Epulopiscium sp. AS2M-Bin002]
MKKHVMVCLLGLVIIFGLVGCGDDEEVTPQQSEEIVAIINGTEISAPLFRTYLWSAQQFFEMLSGPTVWELDIEGQSAKDLAKERALESAILGVVAEEKAKEYNIAVSDQERETIKAQALDFEVKSPGVLQEHKFTVADIEQLLLLADLSTKVQAKMGENYMPSEEDIKKFIDENKQFYETVTSRHILIKTTDDNNQPLPEDIIIEKKALADELLQRVKDGEDIGILAAEYSEDPGSAMNNGEYTFGRGQMVSEFEQASFDGIPGEVWPELVETDFGYHIIETIDYTPADEQQMRDLFIADAKAAFSNSEMTSLIKNAVVEKTPLYNEIQVRYTPIEVQ